jgi:putative membrane protein
METIKLFAIGIILGVANVIPGVSGGTMAVVFGIYNRLIDLISLNVKKIFSQWKFILPLGAGLVTGVLLFSKIITFLFNKFPIQTNWFFIGIILGSIPMIFTHWLNAKKQTPLPEPTDQTDQTEQATQTEQTTKSKKIPISSIICCAISLAIMILMVIS